MPVSIRTMKSHQLLLLGIFTAAVVWYLQFGHSRTEVHSLQQLNRNTHITCDKLHVLVTGGAGFIGSHAALRLMQAGHCVTIIDNFSRGNPGAIWKLWQLNPSRMRFIKAELEDEAAVLSVLESRPQVDLVIHFAAVAYVEESMRDPLRYYSNITSNTITLLRAMRQAGVNQLVYSSTCAVYGNPPTLPVTEETPTVPINPYGKAKLAAEQAVRDFAQATPLFRAVVLRYFNVYGSDPDGHIGEWPRPELRRYSRISGACMDAMEGLVKSMAVMGTKFPTQDGTAVRDYIHVEDLVSAHLAAMPHVANPPALYNVGTGTGTSVRQFAQACKKVCAANLTVEEHEEQRPGDYAAVYADNAKIVKALGWRPKYTRVEEGLQHACEWRKSHPQGYHSAL